MEGGVFYTDGGKRPMGTGWGLHGYTFAIDGKEIKNAKKIEQPTDTGYLDKTLKVKAIDKDGKEFVTEEIKPFADDPVSEEVNSKLVKMPIKKEPHTFKSQLARPVKPLRYIDAWGKMDPELSNNAAELRGVTYALAYAEEHNLKKIKILSDSQYCVIGSTHAENWRRNNWRTGTGKEASNRPLWEDALAAIGKAAEAGREIQFVWVRGHNGEKGNEASDKCATKGVVLNTLEGKEDIVHQEIDAKDYGKVKYDYPRLMAFPVWFFKTNTAHEIKQEDGTYRYVIGTHNNHPEMAGKLAIDHNYGVVYLKEPIKQYEYVMAAQEKLLDSTAETIIFGNNNNIFKAEVIDEFDKNGIDYIYPKKEMYNKDVVLFDKVENGGIPLTHVVKPPRIANRVFEYATLLDYVFERYQAKSDDQCITDLTDLFQVTEKNAKGKVLYSLSDAAKSNLSMIKVEAKHNLKALGTKSFNLAIGFAVPSKNALARLIGEDFKIELVTWRECDIAFRYATVVTSKDGIAIYATHSNSVVCK